MNRWLLGASFVAIILVVCAFGFAAGAAAERRRPKPPRPPQPQIWVRELGVASNVCFTIAVCSDGARTWEGRTNGAGDFICNSEDGPR